MSVEPIIAFGQQPCGFFPRRFLVAKMQTARRLQADMGGRIVFFCHDSDHDPRETRTILRHRTTGEPAQLNFAVANKLQRKFSPLYVKRIAPEWHGKTLLQLPNYVDGRLIGLFRETSAETVADFCLEMYRRMGLLDGMHVARSSDPALRRRACEVSEFFVDVPYEGEIVRARVRGDGLRLHEGGDSFVSLPSTAFTKEQISPTRDTRLRWMQSILKCTHYVAGAGEQAYLHQEEAPEITFVRRDQIDRSDEAYTELPP
jgi:hypothetical protein